MLAWALPGHAGELYFCDQQTPLSAARQDALLRFGAVIKAELERSGASVAIVARSGLDLRRFEQRYSHAGVSLKTSPNAPWSVRQLYFSCDERQPRLYDQGLSGFVLGTQDADANARYVSMVLLPPEPAAALERVALDNPKALRLLAAKYSANAFPFSVRYQNCNQWVMELLAMAWGRLGDDGNPRAQAQRWLRDQGYEPSVFNLHGRPFVQLLGAFIPWLHGDDRPPQDVADGVYRVSMPESIEAFMRTTVPGATRVEFCQSGARVVVRRGWEPIAEGCRPSERDSVITLDVKETPVADIWPQERDAGG